MVKICRVRMELIQAMMVKNFFTEGDLVIVSANSHLRLPISPKFHMIVSPERYADFFDEVAQVPFYQWLTPEGRILAELTPEGFSMKEGN